MDIRKRGRGEFDPNANGAFKRSKPEMDFLSGGIGSKSKPCTKFFSMAGCPFGENCHFLHFFPGGYKAVSQMMNLAPPASNIAKGPLPMQNGSSPATIKPNYATDSLVQKAANTMTNATLLTERKNWANLSVSHTLKKILAQPSEPFLPTLVLDLNHPYKDLQPVLALLPLLK